MSFDWNAPNKKRVNRVTLDISDKMLEVLDMFLSKHAGHTRKSAMELFLRVGAITWVREDEAKAQQVPLAQEEAHSG